MTIEMTEITGWLAYWLAQHDITRDDVRVTIEFQTMDDRIRAEAALIREISPLSRYPTEGYKYIRKMHGIGLTFKSREPTAHPLPYSDVTKQDAGDVNGDGGVSPAEVTR